MKFYQIIDIAIQGHTGSGKNLIQVVTDVDILPRNPRIDVCPYLLVSKPITAHVQR